MDREKAGLILRSYGRPTLKNNKGELITFARQDMTDVELIESMTDEGLERDWKALVWMNNIYGQVSLNEMQRIDLIELEMEHRKLPNADRLIKWLEDETAIFDKKMDAWWKEHNSWHNQLKEKFKYWWRKTKRFFHRDKDLFDANDLPF